MKRIIDRLLTPAGVRRSASAGVDATITYSSYRYGPWRVVINAYFSSDLVQFDRGGTTQNLGLIVPEVGADRPRLGRTWGGSWVDSGADRL